MFNLKKKIQEKKMAKLKNQEEKATPSNEEVTAPEEPQGITKEDMKEFAKVNLNDLANKQREEMAKLESQKAAVQAQQQQPVIREQMPSPSQPINLHPGSDAPPPQPSPEEIAAMQQAYQQRMQAEARMQETQRLHLIKVSIVFDNGITKDFNVPEESLLQVKTIIEHNLINSKTFEIAKSIVRSDKVLFVDFGE